MLVRHFDSILKKTRGLEAFLWNFKTLNVNLLARDCKFVAALSIQ